MYVCVVDNVTDGQMWTKSNKQHNTIQQTVKNKKQKRKKAKKAKMAKEKRTRAQGWYGSGKAGRVWNG